jgi:hypothetical protein
MLYVSTQIKKWGKKWEIMHPSMKKYTKWQWAWGREIIMLWAIFKLLTAFKFWETGFRRFERFFAKSDQDFVGDWRHLSVSVFGEWCDLESRFFVSGSLTRFIHYLFWCRSITLASHAPASQPTQRTFNGKERRNPLSSNFEFYFNAFNVCKVVEP